MKIRAVMTPNVQTCAPDDTLLSAARRMWDHDIGCLVVCQSGRPVAVVTDRDIAMGACHKAQTLGALRVRECMSRALHTCDAEDEVTAVAEAMAEHQVRRLPVVDGTRLVGIVSLPDIARHLDPKAKKADLQHLLDALGAISKPRTTLSR